MFVLQQPVTTQGSEGSLRGFLLMSNCFHSAQLIVADAVLAGVVLVGLVRIHNELYFFPSPRLAETRKLGVVNGQWCVGFRTLPSTDAAELEPLAELLQSPTLLESLEIRVRPPPPHPPPSQALMQVPEGTGP